MKTFTLPAGSSAVFCSDIHLNEGDNQAIEHFCSQLSIYAKKADHIIILGDLFEAWLGDHCADNFQPLFTHFKSLATHTPIYFMPGNRDFLLRDKLLEKYNVRALADPCILVYEGKRILLSHGDQFCSLDTGYLRLRRIIQHPITIWAAHKIPYFIRRLIARRLRHISQYKGRKTSRKLLDACEETILHWMQRYHSSICLYGHVHHLKDQVLTKEPYKRRIVLDSWQHQTNHALLSKGVLNLHTL